MQNNRFNWIRIYLILADYVIPVPLTILMYFLWVAKTNSSTYSFYILLLGLVYGYIVPAFFCNIFKLWKFTWPYQIYKNILVQHGFIYASYLSLILFLVFPDNIQFTGLNTLRIVLSNFALFAIITSHHEILAIRGGMIQNFNSLSAQGKSTVEVIAGFAFVSFGFLGGAYAFCAVYAYQKIIIAQKTSIDELVKFFFICIAIMVLASVPYFIKERKQIVKNRKVG